MRRIKIAILLLITGLAFTMVGCSDSRYDVVKKALEDKYGEEMLVYSVEALGIKYEAKCAPANNPEVVFETRMLTDGTEEWDDYYQRYTAKLMNDILKEDLKQFFPDAYFHSYIYSMQMIDTSMDFREHTLEEIVENSVSEGSYGGLQTQIYVSSQADTSSDYHEEYQYFTETVNQYIEQKKLIPMTVTYIRVDTNALSRVQEYFSRDVDIDSYYENEILGVSSYKSGIRSNEDSDVGSPPNIVACFITTVSGYIGSEEEYIRRREILENGSGR